MWDAYKEYVDEMLGERSVGQLGKTQIFSICGQWANRAQLDLMGAISAMLKAGHRS